MIYLFSQDMSFCISFDNSSYVEIHKNNDCYDVVWISDYVETLATYKTEEDCLKVMEYFRKRLDLGCRTFVFPSQEKIDTL